MISKAKLKELSLYKMQKTCELEHVFVVEGPKMCSEAFSSNLAILTLCATPEWLQSNRQEVEKRVAQGMEVFEVTLPELERISGQKTPNQVWMLLQRPVPSPILEQEPLVVALDRLQDPGNMGTIIRTCDWFGIRTILCGRDTVSCFNPKVVQSTMGAIFRTRILYVDLPQFLPQQQAEGYRVFGALLDGENIYQTTLPSGPSILVIGNESRGISPEVQALVDHRLLIPNLGGTCESLNASVAAGILISEFSSRK